MRNSKIRVGQYYIVRKNMTIRKLLVKTVHKPSLPHRVTFLHIELELWTVVDDDGKMFCVWNTEIKRPATTKEAVWRCLDEM